MSTHLLYSRSSDWLEGKPIAWTELEGKVVLMNVWTFLNERKCSSEFIAIATKVATTNPSEMIEPGPLLQRYL
jgi:hypothetical protein